MTEIDTAKLNEKIALWLGFRKMNEPVGTVKIEPFYVYSNGRSPISVSSYREYIKKEHSKD